MGVHDGDEVTTADELRMQMSEEEIRLYELNKTVIGRYTQEELDRYLDLAASGEKIPKEYKALDDIFRGIDADVISDVIDLAKLEGYVKIGTPVEERVKQS